MRDLVARTAHLGAGLVDHLAGMVVLNATLATIPVLLAVALFHSPADSGGSWPSAEVGCSA